MKLIDADALIERLKPYIDKYGAKKFPYNMVHEAFIYEVEQEPTVDAVPVIRCKDCKNFVDEEDQSYCIDMAGQCDGNGFCAWAERKE